MNADHNIDLHTLQQQTLAYDPSNSVWVSANAGSGKTHVLTQRVVRLLLDDCDSSRILCLTFTKAAASEMTHRIFETLGRWATCEEDILKDQLRMVLTNEPSNDILLHARTLFSRALETPGGLKIQTIHAFCEALLHQFPIEANVPGNFSVMDENQQRELLERSRRAIFEQLSSRDHLKIALKMASDLKVKEALKELIARYHEVGSWLQSVGGVESFTRFAHQKFNFLEYNTLDELYESAVDGCLFSKTELKELSMQCALSDKSSNENLANRLHIFFNSTNVKQRWTALSDIFLKSDGSLRDYSRLCTTDIKKLFPDLENRFFNEGFRLIEAKKRVNLYLIIEGSEALFFIAHDLMNHYQSLKRKQGLLDYDDLISSTANLLRSPSRAWILYQLDRGVNHILLDEAQDTSPGQWKIIRALVEEFFSGESARTDRRTIFAVGDEKQSIYSFQGAHPKLFYENKKWIEDKAISSKQGFSSISLNRSFRSTPDILQAVNAVFSVPENRKGVTFDGDFIPHSAHRQFSSGQVDIWPRTQGEKGISPGEWHESVDLNSNKHQADILAKKIAVQISNWLRTAEFCETTQKRIQPGDIIVLVRARDRFTLALTRYLKNANIPVAGSDRLKLIDHIATQDLLSLASFVLMPEDDLSLAVLLKSPLIGFNEEQLFTVASHRKGSLYESLIQHSNDPFYSCVVDRLRCWMKRAWKMPVYEFYALLLGRDKGRQKILTRLGYEANDVLDAFLMLTLEYEKEEIAGLQAFVEAVKQKAPEIKREFDQKRGEVRIMTVHAAKGLEAPVVFLVDKGSPSFQHEKSTSFYKWGMTNSDSDLGGYLWLPKSQWHNDVTLAAKKQLKEDAEDEYRRLLYVGMTRAKDRLIICGYEGTPKPKMPNWHTMVLNVLGPKTKKVRDESGMIYSHRWQICPQISNPYTSSTLDQSQPFLKRNALPHWIKYEPPREKSPSKPLSPSSTQSLIDGSDDKISSLLNFLKEKDIKSNDNPRRRGIIVHRLFQLLPDIDSRERPSFSFNYLSSICPELEEKERLEMASTVINIIESPDLKCYFHPLTSRAEVSVMGTIDLSSGPRAVSGNIDRISILGNDVHLLDFKIGRLVPESPDRVAKEYLTQMAIYRSLIQPLYPGKVVNCALIWIHARPNRIVMRLPNVILDQAYETFSMEELVDQLTN
ncbi:double-strand break repair helicase AddA [Candidatus Endowatersipora endosymbiont of Watersipora subatra]|uniref:double-strand break repair helicase AddA n=1 Tax=Candidatus Endowatersipora endosymbiont of Watersipora subatra TaxID=3077946 RepID=UPI00312C95AD